MIFYFQIKLFIFTSIIPFYITRFILFHLILKNSDGQCSNNFWKSMNKVSVVIGAQWGDEGKGKIVDMLAQDANIVCRCQVIFKYIILRLNL